MMLRRFFFGALLFASTAVVAGTALVAGTVATGFAQPDVERARTLFQEGVGFTDESRWEEALESFQASAALVDRASTRFNIGNALLRLGRVVEAKEELERYLERPGVRDDEQRTADARELLDAAESQVATYTLRVDPPNAALSVDHRASPLTGAVRTLLLDPGVHTLELTADGHEPLSEEVRALPGPRDLSLALTPRSVGTEAPLGAATSEESASILESPIFWAANGAAVVLTAVLMVVLLSGEGDVDGGSLDYIGTGLETP